MAYPAKLASTRVKTCGNLSTTTCLRYKIGCSWHNFCFNIRPTVTKAELSV